jgi:dCTP deaminase
MILVDRKIRAGIKKGEFGSDFSEDCIQPASYDLRVGRNLWSPQSPSPEKPIDLEESGGAHRIAPYSMAVLQTWETFNMPRDCVGRLGLKSGLARRGLFASIGPQVDPGFEGKLYVSLMNQTPASYIVKFMDTFLTVEFNRLDEKPESVYEGPYQKIKTINPEILDDLIRMEGLNLSQIQSQFTELRDHVKKWSDLAVRFDEFLTEMRLEREAMGRHSTAIESLAKSLAKQAQDDVGDDVEPREITHEQAMQEILQIFQARRKKDIYYSDLMEELQLDLATVVKACEELQQKGKIVGGK